MRWPRRIPGRRLNSRLVHRSRLSGAECAELAEIEAAIGSWLVVGCHRGSPPAAAWVYRDGRVFDFTASASWIRRRHADFVTVAMSANDGCPAAASLTVGEG
jgi:hypothetical protein